MEDKGSTSAHDGSTTEDRGSSSFYIWQQITAVVDIYLDGVAARRFRTTVQRWMDTIRTLLLY